MKHNLEAMLRETVLVCVELRKKHVAPSDNPVEAIAMLANLLHTQAVLFLSELTGGDQALAARTLCQAHLDAG